MAVIKAFKRVSEPFWSPTVSVILARESKQAHTDHVQLAGHLDSIGRCKHAVSCAHHGSLECIIMLDSTHGQFIMV